MRFATMLIRTLGLIAFSAAALQLAGCERNSPEPLPSETAAAEAAVPVEAAAPASAQPPDPVPRLDLGALDERRNPDRLLRFYAEALHARDWSAASRAWGVASGVTAGTLKAAYDRPERATLEVGKGTVEGAAGSLFYEAPVVLRFGPGAPPERGTLTLRRVNDVPGATPEQLRWHIERATIGVGE
jgi:hypothetical protein